VAARNALNGLNGLEQVGVLRQVSVGKRNRAWMAHEVFEVINAFEWDIATPEDPAEVLLHRRHEYQLAKVEKLS